MSDFDEMSLLDRLQVIIDGLRFIGPEKETLIEAKAEIERLRGMVNADQVLSESFKSFREIKQEIGAPTRERVRQSMLDIGIENPDRFLR